MQFRNLFEFYLMNGGDTSRETTMGDRAWDDAVDPDRQWPLRVAMGHDTGDVRAQDQDGRIVLVGTITARWETQEVVAWFREPARGGWPPRPLSWIRDRIATINRCAELQERLGELPRSHAGERCNLCGQEAHVRFRSQPRCEDCMIVRWGGY